MMPRIAFLIVAIGLAVFLSWLSPRLSAPPERQAIARQLIADGRADEAVYLFESHSWRGVAEYRAGRYNRALGEFIREETVTNFYNMGNTYARLHEWRAAKEAYRRALDLDPGHADALHNLAVVERAAEQERLDREKAQATRKMGRWRDGDRTALEQSASAGSKVEEGDAKGGTMRPASAQRGTPGSSDRQGLLGDKPTPGNREAGPASGRADDAAPEDVRPGAGSAAILRASAQDAEILLRGIKDDPARVLAARLKAAHRHRTENQ